MAQEDAVSVPGGRPARESSPIPDPSPRRFRWSLGTLMLAVALAAGPLALIARGGGRQIPSAVLLLNLEVSAVIYLRLWIHCRKEGRRPSQDELEATRRLYQKIFLAFVLPSFLAGAVWSLWLSP